MYLHFSNLEGGDASARVGAELEFNVASSEIEVGKLQAVRAKLLPAGTVKFDITLPHVHTGIISREAKGSKRTFKTRYSSFLLVIYRLSNPPIVLLSVVHQTKPIVVNSN
jgi:hypothetical protein